MLVRHERRKMHAPSQRFDAQYNLLLRARTYSFVALFSETQPPSPPGRSTQRLPAPSGHRASVPAGFTFNLSITPCAPLCLRTAIIIHGFSSSQPFLLLL